MPRPRSLVAAVALLAAAPLPAAAADPPPPLRCLARHFAAVPIEIDGGWALRTRTGATVPWDDGRAKSFEEKLAHPDLEDTLALPYRPGPIRPVTVPDEDPGRVRVDALFTARYGGSAAEVERQLVPIRILGQRLRVHRLAAQPFRRVGERLAALVAAAPSLAPFLERLGGTFNWRPIAGTDRPSAHSYGVSIDINVDRSNYWRWEKGGAWKSRIPQPIVDAFEAEGFIWGGRWFHYDTMHFEFRPELLDEECRIAPAHPGR